MCVFSECWELFSSFGNTAVNQMRISAFLELIEDNKQDKNTKCVLFLSWI